MAFTRYAFPVWRMVNWCPSESENKDMTWYTEHVDLVSAHVLLIYFHIIKFHYLERVLRQFGYTQTFPVDSPENGQEYTT